MQKKKKKKKKEQQQQLVVLSEITTRKRAEEALRETSDYLENLINYASAPIIVWDPQLRITKFNHAFEHLIGYKAEEVIGKQLNVLFPEESRNESLNRIERTLKGEYWQSVEIPILLKDGNVRTVLWNSANIYTEDGTTITATIAQGVDITEKKKAEEELREYQDHLEGMVKKRTADLARANEQLQLEITDRKQAEKALQESEARYRSVFENTGTATVIIEEDMTLSMVNKEAEKLSGYSREELEGKMSWTEFVTKEDLKKMKEYHFKRRKNGEPPPRKHEFRLADKHGNIRDISMNIEMIPGTKKSVASLSDITPHKRAEKQIRESLKEKEVLLQEIHHRVKNNMQIVSSLLNLQSQYVKDKESLEMFKESRDRIFSMASVHEKLYQSKDMAKIDFDDYIRSITRHLILANSIDPNAVRIKINCSDVFLGIDKAIPCGLIINELISNALKHAFPEGKKGEVTIDFHPDSDNRLTLVVSDNGTGFPEDIDIGNTETFGLRLISILVDQLRGTLEIERDGGTVFKIMFNR